MDPTNPFPPGCAEHNCFADACVWCEQHDTSLPELFTRNQRGNLQRGSPKRVLLRRWLWVSLRELGYTYPTIAALHGGSHTPVIDAVKMATRLEPV